jgi:hypothetical protein
MKNTLLDLNNHLFDQLSRLSNDNITEIALETEVVRTRAILSIAGGIVETAKVAIEARKAFFEIDNKDIPELLRLDNKSND